MARRSSVRADDFPRPGTLVLGRYRLGSTLGRGGESRVFLARDLESSTEVAVKIWRGTDFSRDLREMGLLRSLCHPGVVLIRGGGLDRALGRAVLVMDRIEGIPLVEAFRTASPADRNQWMFQIFEAVAYLHRLGILHGDIKPANVIVAPGRGPVILDFGMSRAVGEEIVGGTPAYFSPELRRGEAGGFPSDVFALGVTLLQAFLGEKRPRRAVPRGRELPGLAGAILPRMMEARPERRYRDATLVLARALALTQSSGRVIVPARLPYVGHEGILRRATDELFRRLLGEPSAPAVIRVTAREGMGARRFGHEAALLLQSRSINPCRWDRDVDLRTFGAAALIARGLSPTDAHARLSDVFAEGTKEAWQGGGSPIEAVVDLLVGTEGEPLVLLGPLGGTVSAQLLAALLRRLAVEKKSRWAALLLRRPDDPHVASDLDLELGPLGLKDLQRLVGDIGGTSSSNNAEEVARALHEVTGGTPVLVDSVLREAAARGTLRTVDGVLRLELANVLSATYPEHLARGVRERLQSLEVDETRVLAQVLTAGRSVEVEDLSRTLGWERAKTAASIERLVAAGFVQNVEHGDRIHLAGGARELLEAALAAMLDGAHTRWADVSPDPERTWHRAKGGQAVPAKNLLDTVDALLHLGANRQALELVDCLSRRGAPAPRGTWRLQRVRILVASGDLGSAAAELETHLSDTSDTASSEVARLASEVFLARGDNHRALEWAHHAQRGSETPIEEAQALVQEGLIRLLQSDLPGAESAATSARHVSEPRSVEDATARNILGLVAARRSDWALARGFFDAAWEHLLARDRTRAAARVAVNLGSVLAREGEICRARTVLTQAVESMRLLADPRGRAQALINRGVLENGQGNNRRALEDHREARRLSLGVGDATTAALGLANAGIAAFDGGRPFVGQRLLQEARLALESTGHARGHALVLSHLARALAHRGRSKAARRVAATVLWISRRGRTPRERIEAFLAAGETSPGTVGITWLRRARNLANQGREFGLGAEAMALESARHVSLGDLAVARDLRARIETSVGVQSVVLPLDARLAPRGSLGALAAALRWTLREGHHATTVSMCLLASRLSVQRTRFGAAWRWYCRAMSSLTELEEGMSPRGRTLQRITILGQELEELFRATENNLVSLERTSSGAAHQELPELLRLLHDMGSALSVKTLLGRVVDSALHLTRAERGFVVLKSPRDGLRFGVARAAPGILGDERRDRVSSSIIREVLALGRTLLISDAAEHERFAGLDSVSRVSLRSLACVPLRSGGDIVGALYLDGGDRIGAFTDVEIPLLEAFAELAALAVSNLRRTQKRDSERVRLTKELESVRVEGQAREREASELRKRLGRKEILGKSRVVKQLKDMIDRAARIDATVLISGESGVGKELVAARLHERSDRARGPFVAVNCGAIPSGLFESELMGHKKGSFTGAVQDSPGLLMMAHGGTLFLDEIGEIPLRDQPKLLRVLETREVRPVGGGEPLAFDARVVVATNRDLRSGVQIGTFREDLFYRINGFEIHVPALRERAEDIEELALHFVWELSPRAEILPEVVERLSLAPWPGNVRQLKNEIERAFILSGGTTLRLDHLSKNLFEGRDRLPSWTEAQEEIIPLRELEKRAIQRALLLCGKDRQEAARKLGISRSTLYEKIKRLDA